VATRIESFRVVVPAGTLPTAPLETDVSFEPGEVQYVDVVIPSGHAGLTGIALGRNGAQVWPSRVRGFITADAATFRYNLERAGNSGRWSTFTYNVSAFAHSFYLYFAVYDPLPVEPGFAPLSIGAGTTEYQPGEAPVPEAPPGEAPGEGEAGFGPTGPAEFPPGYEPTPGGGDGGAQPIPIYPGGR